MGESCFWCGASTDLARDHVIPSSFYQNKRSFDHGNLVISCKECNSLAGDKVFPSPFHKANYLRKKLKKRYEALLRTKDWYPEELEELSYGLRRVVEESIAQRDHIRARLKNLAL